MMRLKLATVFFICTASVVTNSMAEAQVIYVVPPPGSQNPCVQPQSVACQQQFRVPNQQPNTLQLNSGMTPPPPMVMQDNSVPPPYLYNGPRYQPMPVTP
jgi:hypothetical protein